MKIKFKNVYISGCGGMLGEAFYEIFSKKFNLKCTDKTPLDSWLSELDFTDFKKYKDDVFSHSSDLLIHLGAMTSLEECEADPKITFLNNTKSVEHAVRITNQLNIPLVFISTAGIFDGKKDFYIDEDIPNPLSCYGRSKYEAEKFIEKNSKDYIICRAGWMMGGGKIKDKKFIYKIIKQLLNGQKVLNIVNDKNGTPTYTYDFAKQTLLLLENNIRGKFNAVCEGLTSRIEVAEYILKFYNLQNKVKINEVDSNFFNSEYFAVRPVSERLMNKKLNSISMNIMRDWKICLEEYLNKNFKEIL